MAKYDVSHGGLPLTSGNVGMGHFPSKEVGPYEHMEASAHYRPTTFTVNRHLWWEDSAPMEYKATGSEALQHFLRELKAANKNVGTGDELTVITLPLDYELRNVYVRVDRPLAGLTFDLVVVDQNEAEVLTIASGLDGSVPHLGVEYDPATQMTTYTENFIAPIDVKALNGGEALYLGHNHELVMKITACPDEGIGASGIRIATELFTPWLGAW